MPYRVYFNSDFLPAPIVLLKSVVILMMLAIFASLAAALVFLFRDRGRRDNRRMARALTWRVGLSVTLFLLPKAGFYFGFISPTGLTPR